jgi:hypothetical protein
MPSGDNASFAITSPTTPLGFGYHPGSPRTVADAKPRLNARCSGKYSGAHTINKSHVFQSFTPTHVLD